MDNIKRVSIGVSILESCYKMHALLNQKVTLESLIKHLREVDGIGDFATDEEIKEVFQSIPDTRIVDYILSNYEDKVYKASIPGVGSWQERIPSRYDRDMEKARQKK